MDLHSIRPSRWLLTCWAAGIAVVGVLVGKAAEGVCTVMGYPADRGLAIAFGATCLLGGLAATAHFLSLRYGVDAHYVTKDAGVLWRHRRSIPLAQLTSVAVRQGPLEQLLRIGQVRVYTAASGSDAPEERLLGVRDPLAIKTAILQAAESERQHAATEALLETRELRKLFDAINQQLTSWEPKKLPNEARQGSPNPGTAATVRQVPDLAGKPTTTPAAEAPRSEPDRA
jgi:membrane protein YdbS with pleckstrin-like domain